MRINDLLLPGEEVLASSPPFHATNFRLLRVDSKLISQSCADVKYSLVSSVKLVKKGSWAPFIMAFGFMFVSFLFVPGGFTGYAVAESISMPLSELALIFCGVSLALGFFMRKSWYEVRAPGVSSLDWRIPASKSTEKLVNVLHRKVYLGEEE